MNALKQTLMAAAIGVALAAGAAAQPPEPPEGHMMSPHGHIALMVRALGLNAEQKTAFDGLVKGMMNDRHAGYAAHEAIHKLALSDDFDAGQLDTLAQQQAELERAALVDNATKLHAFYASLTPEQQKVFSEIEPHRRHPGEDSDKPPHTAK